MAIEKTYVLDTSVLIHDPNGALSAFKEHTVVIPVVVIEELDRLKHHAVKGVNAREVSRQLAELMQDNDILKGVPTPGGGTLRVDLDGDDVSHLPSGFDPEKSDNIILLTTMRLKSSSPDREITLVSKDINLRIKAQSVGLRAQDYLSGRIIEKNHVGSSIIEITVNDEVITLIHQPSLTLKGKVRLKEADLADKDFSSFSDHTCFRLVGKEHRKTSLALLNKQADWLELVAKPSVPSTKKGGVLPRNDEQAFALALACSQNTTLVTLVGAAGTGKSLMALLAGWRLIVGPNRGFERPIIEGNFGSDQRMVIYRPTRELGEELGFLPGTLDEKLAPWQRPTLSNLYLIATEDGKDPTFVDELLEKRKIEILPINHIRGDTVNHAFVIVDDAQNLTPHEIKAVITRVGEGTKMVITGDPTQVDVDFLDSHSNGFSYVVAKFRGQEIYANLELVKGERSKLAEVAASIL
ncbi:MAG: PhoH family protein [bacterium]|nr:PhoH family protein [bacterium]